MTQTASKAEAPDSGEFLAVWPVFSARQGVLLFNPDHFEVIDDEAILAHKAGAMFSSSNGVALLPACRTRDEILQQPALGLALTPEEARDLLFDSASSDRVAAATDIGPVGQDKGSNQDFALAATFHLRDSAGQRRKVQFVAVADGVTTRTFWPERSSRLAALVAWQVAREHAKSGDFSRDGLERLRNVLVRRLSEAMAQDRNLIINSGTVPTGWDPALFRSLQGRAEYWYNSTLIVAMAGADGGFVLSCGDGGAVVTKRSVPGESKTFVLVRSTDDLSVSGVVSMTPDAMRFKSTLVRIEPGDFLEITLSSDGVDRSLRRTLEQDTAEADPYGAMYSNLDSAALLDRVQSSLAPIADREIDNVSVATLRWPPSAGFVEAGRYQPPRLSRDARNGVRIINERVAEMYRRPTEAPVVAAAAAPAAVADEEEEPHQLSQLMPEPPKPADVTGEGSKDTRPRFGDYSISEVELALREVLEVIEPCYVIASAKKFGTRPLVVARELTQVDFNPAYPDQAKLMGACDRVVILFTLLRHFWPDECFDAVMEGQFKHVIDDYLGKFGAHTKVVDVRYDPKKFETFMANMPDRRVLQNTVLSVFLESSVRKRPGA